MAGSSDIRKATGSIRDAIGRATRAAQLIAGEAEAAATGLEQTAGEGLGVVKDLADAHAELRDALGLAGTNGGPRVDPTAEASAVSGPQPPASGIRTEVTATGPVQRVDG